MAVAQFGFAIEQQLDERPVDVAEAKKAEVVSLDEVLA